MASHKIVPQFPYQQNGGKGYLHSDYTRMLLRLNETSAKPSALDQTQKNRSTALKISPQEGPGVWTRARKGHCWGPLLSSWVPSPCPAHLVVVFLHEAAQRQAKALVGPHAPVHGVDGPGRFILVDLLPFAVQGHSGGGRAAVRAGSAAGLGGQSARRAGSRAWDPRVRKEAGQGRAGTA